MSASSMPANPIEVTNAVLNTWATDTAGPVALRLKQKLLPVEESGIIFPPTYADIGYNVNTLSDGARVATIDSVGSQANRLEPIFKAGGGETRDNWLVPQLEIIISREDCGQCDACKKNAEVEDTKKKQKCESPHEVKRSILDLAHRAADAVVQSSPTLRPLVEHAFQALRRRGDAGPLCAIAPTSLVFGVWDSRGDSGEKRPRLVRSIIRAWDVEPLHAAAQFNSIWKALDEEQQNELKKESKAKKAELSTKGLKDAPAVFRKLGRDAGKYMQKFRDGSPNPDVRVLGGVIARGAIEREVTVNLVALRGLRGTLPDPKDGNKRVDASDEIRKYLLGLSLVAATTDIDLFLREGCLLRYADNGDTWYQVPRRGEPTQVRWAHDAARKYAEAAAGRFRRHWPDDAKLKHDFNLAEAKKLLAKKTAEEGAETE
ncbi:MAG: type I-U CRISPR-associated protein Cas7 [Acidobacteria bacterium]|nr:type I-U CRISPR-associated protein Cas7 [Acidobacteriota bacterium]